MKFVQTSPETAIQEITRYIENAFKSGPVLLLLSGGSNIVMAVEIRKRLHINGTLTIGLIDERYGPVGHPDSNWAQLIHSGLDMAGLQELPVLETGKSFEETAASYRQKLEQAFQNHRTAIGIFGMGADGHIAGILPDSEALTHETLVKQYEGPDYKRITVTPGSLHLFDQTYLVAYGDTKHEQLQKLTQIVAEHEQPAQMLKKANECTVYNDYIQGEF